MARKVKPTSVLKAQFVADADWLRTSAMVHYTGFHAATLYRLADEGEITSFLLKRDRNNVRGARLWNRPSFDAYLKRQYAAAQAEGNPKGKVAWQKNNTTSPTQGIRRQ